MITVPWITEPLELWIQKDSMMKAGLGRGLGLALFCRFKLHFPASKLIHRLEKNTIRGGSGSMDHGSGERWTQKACKAARRPRFGWGITLENVLR